MAYLLTAEGGVFPVNPRNGVEFEGPEIHAMIGGYFEIVRVIIGVSVQADNAAFTTSEGDLMLLDDNGKLMGKPVNPLATRLYVHGGVDPIVGDVLLVRAGEIS